MSDSKSSPRHWVTDHISSLPRSGIRDFFELVNQMDDVISLGIGEPDFVTPWHIREAAIYALNQGFTHYTSNLGDLRLRKAICRYAKERFGVSYDPAHECLVTVGVSEGLDILLRAVLSPGDEVLYPEPGYVIKLVDLPVFRISQAQETRRHRPLRRVFGRVCGLVWAAWRFAVDSIPSLAML